MNEATPACPSAAWTRHGHINRDGDFYLATTGDLHLATSGDFLMATDTLFLREQAAITQCSQNEHRDPVSLDPPMG